MSNRKVEEEVPQSDDDNDEQPKKKKKTNLRISKNPEDRKYVTSTADYMKCASIVNQDVQKKTEISRKREEERAKKQKERDEIKKEKRLERYERSLTKKNKLKDAASAAIEDKKERVRELYHQRQEEMGGKKKQRPKRTKNE